MFTALGRCLDCNYLLVSLPDPRCPECGRRFDPADASTMNLGSELTPAARWALGPTGIAISLLVLAAAGYTLWSVRLPTVAPQRTRLTGFILSLLGILWLLWPLLRHRFAHRNGWRAGWLTAGRPSRLWLGLLMLAMGLLTMLDLPRRFAFQLSRPSMNAIAQQMIDVHKSAPRDQWLGVFPARSIQPVPGGARFTTTRDGDGEAGFIYLPKADPTNAGWASRQYIGDGWWTWREER